MAFTYPGIVFFILSQRGREPKTDRFGSDRIVFGRIGRRAVPFFAG
jgi:hypothetical protein